MHTENIAIIFCIEKPNIYWLAGKDYTGIVRLNLQTGKSFSAVVSCLNTMLETLI